MSETPTRTIKINPELFNFQSIKPKNTRKNNNIPKEMKMKIRTHAKEKSTKTLKRSVLNFIRNHQEKNLKNALNTKNPVENNTNDMFQTDFKESLDYLEKITKDNEFKVKPHMHNSTLKNYNNIDTSSILFQPSVDENVNILLPTELLSTNIEPLKSQNQYKYHNPIIKPQYGCLKGGTLPTWRNYTQKNRPNVSSSPIINNHSSQHQNNRISTFVGGDRNPQQNQNQPPVVMNMNMNRNQNTATTFNQPRLDNTQQIKINELSHMKDKMNKMQNVKKPKFINKQKKTLTRTYKVGKSKIQPKIAVLVSNKTIRKNINNKAQLLKQTPIQEIKKYLIKKGFIRVGSIAPNDVLRKMYETATLMCGEIQNHNPDNILFNYLNSQDK